MQQKDSFLEIKRRIEGSKEGEVFDVILKPIYFVDKIHLKECRNKDEILALFFLINIAYQIITFLIKCSKCVILLSTNTFILRNIFSLQALIPFFLTA